MAAATSSTTAAFSATGWKRLDAMPTLYLIHGFVGVGKTTFSKKLEKETGTTRFTPDEWMIAEYGNNPQGDFAVLEKHIKDKIWAAAQTALHAGKDVILDYGFWKRADREDYKERGKNLGAEVVLYNLVCNESVSTERTIKRTAAKESGALFIDENALVEFRQYYEPVAADENAVTIETS
jgi:predicted kinase